MLQSLVYYIQFGQAQFLTLFLVLLCAYLAWRMSTLIAERYVYRNTAASQTLRSLLQALATVSVTMLVLFWLIGFAIERINFHPHLRADISVNNARLMQADHRLFGTYLPFWFQDTRNVLKDWFDGVGPLLLKTYNSLSVMLGVTLLGLIFTKPTVAVRLCVVFIVSLLMSIPIWYFFPALSPLEGYRQPVLERQMVLPEIEATLAMYQPNDDLQHFFDRIGQLRERGDKNFFAVTTLPSMHIAWVTALLWYSSTTWLPLLAIFLPYFLLNVVATVYTLQHYAIDIPAGLVVAILALVIVGWLKPERWPALRVVIQLLRDDVRVVRKFIASFGQ